MPDQSPLPIAFLYQYHDVLPMDNRSPRSRGSAKLRAVLAQFAPVPTLSAGVIIMVASFLGYEYARKLHVSASRPLKQSSSRDLRQAEEIWFDRSGNRLFALVRQDGHANILSFRDGADGMVQAEGTPIFARPDQDVAATRDGASLIIAHATTLLLYEPWTRRTREQNIVGADTLATTYSGLSIAVVGSPPEILVWGDPFVPAGRSTPAVLPNLFEPTSIDPGGRTDFLLFEGEKADDVRKHAMASSASPTS
jgi:hypothetical protein